MINQPACVLSTRRTTPFGTVSPKRIRTGDVPEDDDKTQEQTTVINSRQDFLSLLLLVVVGHQQQTSTY
jgi:hypothetical protein